MATSWTPQLENNLKPEIPAAAKTTDKELAVNQTHILDALAPLSTIIETRKGISKQILDAAAAAIKLLGNASA